MISRGRAPDQPHPAGQAPVSRAIPPATASAHTPSQTPTPGFAAPDRRGIAEPPGHPLTHSHADFDESLVLLLTHNQAPPERYRSWPTWWRVGAVVRYAGTDRPLLPAGEHLLVTSARKLISRHGSQRRSASRARAISYHDHSPIKKLPITPPTIPPTNPTTMPTAIPYRLPAMTPATVPHEAPPKSAGLTAIRRASASAAVGLAAKPISDVESNVLLASAWNHECSCHQAKSGLLISYSRWRARNASHFSASWAFQRLAEWCR